MKKIIISSILLLNFYHSFSQNSAETIPDGTKPVFRTTGYGTASGFTQKVSILGQTGNATTSSNLIGVLGSSNASTNTNFGLFGNANGSSSQSNIGVNGSSTVFNGSGTGIKGTVYSNSVAADFLFGGHFMSIAETGVNGSAISYGLVAQSIGTGSITSSYGSQIITNLPIAVSSMGVQVESNASGGTGTEIGGGFSARGSSTGALKIGVSAKSTGTTLTSYRYGVQSMADGPASTESYGVHSLADNSGNGTSYGGYFKAQGVGSGSKYGIYATTAGSGSQVAAALIGKVGINTEVPVEPLTVYSITNSYGISNTDGSVKLSTYLNAAGGWFGTKSNHPLNFYVNDSGVMATLLTNGNFGIGIVNPSEKLHVSGNIKASGNINTNTLTVTNGGNITGSLTLNNTLSGTDANFSGSLNVGGVLSPDVLNIGGTGSAITKIKRTTLSAQQIFGVVNNTCDLNYYSVPGAVVGDNVILNIDSPFSSLTVANVRVSAADQVEVKFCNIGNSNTVLLTGLTFRFMYYR
jgi:hypothetical protein